jgi:hypothetical protein
LATLHFTAVRVFLSSSDYHSAKQKAVRDSVMSKDNEQQLPKRRRISPEFSEVLHMLASLEKTTPLAQSATPKN